MRDPSYCNVGQGQSCLHCGFERHEAARRKHIPMTEGIVDVPFTTNWSTPDETTEYVKYWLKRKVIRRGT
jgi:hypothetical protein